MTNFYGDGGHTITYPINDEECSWASVSKHLTSLMYTHQTFPD